MFDMLQKGVGVPCIYTELVHDRPQDKQMMHDWQAETVLILSPDQNKVSKIWAEMIQYANNPIVVLRKWEWDDNRRYEGDPGVYAKLEADPLGLAQEDVGKWRNFIDQMRWQAQDRDEPFPDNTQIRCHLVNEPNTNNLTSQIETYTYEAIRLADPMDLYLLIYNFGSGHPAPQVGGDGTSPDWGPYEDSMRAAVSGGHTIGTHEYYNRQGVRGPDMLYWQTMRHYWAAHFLETWGLLEEVDWWITEWGFEGLVNNDMEGHHGWQGVLSAQEYANDWHWYLTNVACYVKRVIMYCNDLSDRIWWTFDPQPAAPQMEVAADSVWTAWTNTNTDCTSKEPPPPDPDPTDGPMWPCDGVITQRFGENPEYYEEELGIKAHNGLDIGNDDGTIIVSVGDGVVEWSDWDEKYGWYVRIWHEDYHFHSFYAHLEGKAMVAGGDKVSQGQVIGAMGNTGNSTGPHLHFETRMGERYKYWNITAGYRRGRANPECVYAAHGLEW